MWIRYVCLGGLALISMAAHAAPSVSSESIRAQASRMQQIVTLPIRGMRAVQSQNSVGDSQILFVSDTGRFAISGQLIDILQQKPLSTLSEMQDVASRLDLKKLGLDVKTLNTITLGVGAQEVVVFIDPRSPSCLALAKEARALTKHYTFQFVLIPVLGDKSHQIAKQVNCETDKARMLTALLNGTLEKHLSQSTCRSDAYERTLLLAQLIPIEGVPTLIAPDGRIHRGRPPHLKTWLEQPS